MKKVAGKLKLDLAQFRELEAFAQFGSDLDEATKKQIEMGRRVTEILKQGQYKPIDQPLQVAIIYAVIQGLLDEVAIEKLAEFEEKLFNKMTGEGKDVLKEIGQTGDFSEKSEKKMKKIILDLIEMGFK